MDKPKRQIMRYTDAEISLIKATFKDEDVLKEIRKYFLQMEANLNLAPDAIKLLRKTLLPELDGNAPMHQVIDLWLTVNVKDKNPEDALIFIRAREILISYFEEMFAELEGGKKHKLKLSKMVETSKPNAYANDVISNLVARNEIVTHIEQQLAQLNVLAIQDTQKLVDDMLKNSAK